MNSFYRLGTSFFFFILFTSSRVFAATSQAKSASGLETFINSTMGKSLIVTFFFGIIALFLRFLYGPKGILREKEWDALNSSYLAAESIKKQRAASLNRVQSLKNELEPLTQKEGAIFSQYVASFYADDPAKNELYRLKEIHSFAVFKNAWLLIQGESELQNPLIARPLLLAAIYHDCGRFEQIKHHKSFMDKTSLDHALLGANILKNNDFLANETPETRRLVRGAVLLHSRAEIPQALRERHAHPLGMIARALRDADKIDIIKIMTDALRPGSDSDPSVYYQLPDEAKSYSPEAVQAILKNRPILTQHMHFCNDFRLRICGWAGMFEFETTRKILNKNRHIEIILSYLPDDENMRAVREATRKNLDTNNNAFKAD